MTKTRTALSAALLLAFHASASSQTQPMQQVTITASTIEQRAQSTTTAIVVGREEILRQGDASLVEVLKRQPGISIDGAPGKPAIRMRGLGAGYVAILLNGLPAPGGFSLETMDPALVERIEIMRAPTAETNGQAVAGAINIVLRKPGKAAAPQTELKAGSFIADGRRLSPTLNAQHSGRLGAVAYTLTLAYSHKQESFQGLATEESLARPLLRHLAWIDRQVNDRLELTPRLDWQPSPRDTLSSQSWVRWKRINNAKLEREDTAIGESTSFPRGASSYRARSPAQGYADLSWTRKLDAGARFSAKLSGYSKSIAADFLYRGTDALDTLLETHHVDSGQLERGLNLNGSYRRPIFKTHALALGWDLGRTQREEFRREHQADAGGRPLLDSDEDFQATVRRSAFWIQDEWDLSEAWSAYLGLRREDLHTAGAGSAHAGVDVDAGVWSPIFQTLFKPGGAGNKGDQFRFALSRTYKAPDIIQLMPRRYTVDNNNSATNPDQQGNPNLRPELSLGVDLAWERYFGKEDMLSVSAFAKRIRDITLDRVFEQNGVWIVTPSNEGAALVRGLEFEAKTHRGALAGRMNLARNWSRLEAVAGPDNRIAGQPAWTGNLGLDYAASPLADLGGTYTVRSGFASRQSPLLADYGGPKRQLDLYAVWKRDARSRLRLSVSDLLHPNYLGRSVYAGDPDLRTSYVYRNRTVWRVQWEQSL
ncbi:TonB-dependent receptor plug domain-containing protein [Massilia aerilata]|uniref:TonB-dependent receptor plug domain-containing protein n=1 Tax=Massilia aerilata TaxID=453817 RepID=A0ABW0S1W6_9BURK